MLAFFKEIFISAWSLHKKKRGANFMRTMRTSTSRGKPAAAR